MRRKIKIGKKLTRIDGTVVEIVKVFNNKELFLVKEDGKHAVQCVSLDEVKAGYYKF